MSPSRRRAIGAVRGFAPCAPPVPRCGSPSRCAAWQVAHTESCPRHGARQGRAPGAMLGRRCLPARAAITHAHYPGGAIGTSRPTAITPPCPAPLPCAPLVSHCHPPRLPARTARTPFPCSTPVPRCGTHRAAAPPARCAALPCVPLPHTLAALAPWRLATPLPTRITRAARFAAWHLARPRCPPKKRPPKRPCKKRRIVKYLRCYARHFRQQSTYRTPCRSTVMG